MHLVSVLMDSDLIESGSAVEKKNKKPLTICKICFVINSCSQVVRTEKIVSVLCFVFVLFLKCIVLE